MEDLKRKKEILKAIRQSLANLALEEDSMIDINKLDNDIEKIYIKIVKEKKYG